MVALEKSGQSLLPLLTRHAAGDWGDTCPEDVAANEQALITGARLMSAYALSDGTKVWIITDAANDCGRRLCTTVPVAGGLLIRISTTLPVAAILCLLLLPRPLFDTVRPFLL